MAFKGKLHMRVYNPDKPDTYGINFYILGEAKTGYVLDFKVYTGEPNTTRDIVFTLMEKHLHKGYHLYMDNYYNSVAITKELFDNGTHSCGTLRLNRGALKALQALTKQKGEHNELHYRKKTNTFVICWQDTRLVSIIMNLKGINTEEYIHRKRIRTDGRVMLQETRLDQPVAIKKYIKFMSGVDRFDQMIKYYAFAHKTMKWTKKVMLYLFQMMLQNVHILYNK